MTYPFLESLHSRTDIKLADAPITVGTSSYAETSAPVQVYAGPMSMSLTLEQAIELGTELIAAAHHYRAALAEFHGSQNDGDADEVTA